MNKLTKLALSSIFLVSAIDAQASTTTLGFNDATTNPVNTWFSFLGTPVQIGSPYSAPTAVGGDGNVAIVSPVVNGFNSQEHIHLGGAGGAINFYTHTDTGGIYFNVATLDSNGYATQLNPFSFDSMDILQRDFTSASLPNTSYTIRGYKGGTNGMASGGADTGGQFKYVGGTQVAEVVLTNATPLGNFNFLAADDGFGDVDHVEMFFTSYYRSTLPGSNDLFFQFDNVNISDVSNVPVPAAVWLFGSGLLGLLSLGKRNTIPKSS